MKTPLTLVTLALVLVFCAWRASSLFDASDTSALGPGAPGPVEPANGEQGTAQ